MVSLIKIYKRTPLRQKLEFFLAVALTALIVIIGLKKIGIFASTEETQITNTATLTYQDQNGATQTIQSNTVTTTVNSPSNNIQLEIALQGRTDSATSGTVFSAYAPGSDSSVYTKSDVTTDQTGSANFDTPLQNGNYDFRLKVPRFLSGKLTNQSLPSEIVFNFGTLKAGDLNDDNIVNSLDFSLLNGKWLQPDELADINGDGVVNTLDFSLINGNWLIPGQ